jgi:hypothetical protein
MDVDAQCPTHPGTPATLACERCGTFACRWCAVEVVPPRLKDRFTRYVCEKCLKTVVAELDKNLMRPSLRAGIVFYGAFVFAFSPLAPVFAMLAVQELLAIRAGTAPLAGKWWTVAGLVISVTFFSLFVVLFVTGAFASARR